MKKIILFFTLILFASCGVTIKSIVDHSSEREIYKNPLIVIPYQSETETFSNKLKENLDILFKADQKKVAFFLFENKKDELKLNASSEIDNKINNLIQDDNKDLIIIFKPANLSFYNGGLQSATYQIVASDAHSHREIWKAEFNSSSSFGPSLFAQKSAKTIYEKLKSDKVL